MTTEEEKKGEGKMKPGDVKVKLRDLDGAQGEYIITDGCTHKLHSPWLHEEESREIDRVQLETILQDRSDLTIADLAVILLI